MKLVKLLAEELVTFDLIRRVQREEQMAPKLTRLPENFYASVASYVTNKKKLVEGKEDRKVGLEIKSVEMLIEDVFNRRERKIINTAINSARTGIPPENMTDEERAFYDGLLEFIKGRRDSILQNILAEPEVKEEEESEIEGKIAEVAKEVKVLTTKPSLPINLGASLIVFREDVTTFVGSDMRSYGPFKKGDIAKVPNANMRILLDMGVVEEFKVSKE